MATYRYLIRGCLTRPTSLPLSISAAVGTAAVSVTAQLTHRVPWTISSYPHVQTKTHIFVLSSPSSPRLQHSKILSKVPLTSHHHSTTSPQVNQSTTMDTVRVAILDCDTTVPNVAAKYGKYFSSMFISKLQSAMERSDTQKNFEFSSWKAMQSKFPDPSTIDAIMVTGGVGSAYDPDPWITNTKRYIANVFKNYPNILIFGGCLGHQIVSHALLYDHGIQAEKNPQGGQFGIKTVELNPTFTSYFPDAIKDAKMLRLQVVHGDHVHIPSGPLPEGWIAVGSSPRCANHGLFLPQRVLTLQSHFEFDEFANYETIKSFLTHKAGYSQHFIKTALDNTKGEDDSEIAADLVLSFLASEPIQA